MRRAGMHITLPPKLLQQQQCVCERAGVIGSSLSLFSSEAAHMGTLLQHVPLLDSTSQQQVCAQSTYS